MRHAVIAGGFMLLLAEAARPATLSAAPPPVTADGRVVLRVPLTDDPLPFVGKIARIKPGGVIFLTPSRQPQPDGPARGAPLTEGYYLGLLAGTAQRLDGAQVLRVEVTNLHAEGIVEAKVAPDAAAKLPPRQPVLLIRPQATTAMLKTLPGVLVIDTGPAPHARPAEAEQARIARSVGNLYRIGAALQKFHETYGQFPPARLVGPDGKPWHSSRVLLLPYLDETTLFRKYRLNEPWDSAHNKQFVTTMPNVFTDEPADAAADEARAGFTRYAAVTGLGLAFPPEGAKFDGKYPRGSGIAMHHVADGASVTLAIGTLATEDKILWTEPEDILVDDPEPRLNAQSGFGAPYTSEQGKFALFARLDGGVLGLVESVEPRFLRTLFTIAGSEAVDARKLAAAEVRQIAATQRAATVLYLLREGDQIKARATTELIPGPSAR
ncbi:MAG: DUF1559 domain-containing protein [Planctomycetaceae bacterium]|nr:DUF1559 domain-containing protein [Planctomycetaceae bacterium]